jgi:hypothetical protein
MGSDSWCVSFYCLHGSTQLIPLSELCTSVYMEYTADSSIRTVYISLHGSIQLIPLSELCTSVYMEYTADSSIRTVFTSVCMGVYSWFLHQNCVYISLHGSIQLIPPSELCVHQSTWSIQLIPPSELCVHQSTWEYTADSSIRTVCTSVYMEYTADSSIRTVYISLHGVYSWFLHQNCVYISLHGVYSWFLHQNCVYISLHGVYSWFLYQNCVYISLHGSIQLIPPSELCVHQSTWEYTADSSIRTVCTSVYMGAMCIFRLWSHNDLSYLITTLQYFTSEFSFFVFLVGLYLNSCFLKVFLFFILTISVHYGSDTYFSLNCLTM